MAPSGAILASQVRLCVLDETFNMASSVLYKIGLDHPNTAPNETAPTLA